MRCQLIFTIFFDFFHVDISNHFYFPYFHFPRNNSFTKTVLFNYWRFLYNHFYLFISLFQFNLYLVSTFNSSLLYFSTLAIFLLSIYCSPILQLLYCLYIVCFLFDISNFLQVYISNLHTLILHIIIFYISFLSIFKPHPFLFQTFFTQFCLFQ